MFQQTPEKKHSESSRGRKRKADTYSESSQGTAERRLKSVFGCLFVIVYIVLVKLEAGEAKQLIQWNKYILVKQ